MASSSGEWFLAIFPNRNVDQQKALVFQSDTCKYDVILGVDFLTETEIDVKYVLPTEQELIPEY